MRGRFLWLMLLAAVAGCGGLDPAVERSVVFTAERAGDFVFEDTALSDQLVGDRGLDDTVVAVAACHSLLGHAGDWSVRPHLVVSARLDLVRAAEVVDSGAVSRADAEQIESFLFDRADADVDPATIARETTVRTPVVEEYLQLRSQAPSPAELAKFAVYVQNETQMVQRIVVVNRQGLVDVDFDGLSRQYSSVEYQLAGDGEVRSYDKSDCARLVQE